MNFEEIYGQNFDSFPDDKGLPLLNVPNHKFTAMCNLIQMFRVTRAQEIC